MAQLNPNFEIDFSDINSYEQIQLINDTQLAKENLLMHRAYKEPSDDEIIRNHFSSFTFVDFCPKLYSTQPPTYDCDTKSFSNNNNNNNNNIQQQFNDSHGSKSLRYYELETFSDLFERINTWLKLNKDWRVVSMQTLVYDCNTQFNHLKSSIYSNYLPQNTRGLRLFLSPSKSRFSGPQKIGCINVVPRKLSGDYMKPNEPIVYETLDEILQRLNELLLTRPIEGRILSVETITLPMVNGYVNTETNYFMDNRLNLLNESTYNIASKHNNTGNNNNNNYNNSSNNQNDDQLYATNSCTTSEQQRQQGSNLRGHTLIDILRVYYEFGPMVCGLVNLIDFVPKFYSTNPNSAVSQSNEATASSSASGRETPEQSCSSNTAGGGEYSADSKPNSRPTEKIAPTESLTRLIRRSLAWFESERKRILDETSGGSKYDAKLIDDDQPVQPSTSGGSSSKPVNLRVCNLQVYQKTFLKGNLVHVNPTNALQSLNTRSMVHERVASGPAIVCGQCSISTSNDPVQNWCQHVHQLSQPYNLKFVRLAYVVPVYNRYALSICSLRPSLRVSASSSTKEKYCSRENRQHDSPTLKNQQLGDEINNDEHIINDELERLTSSSSSSESEASSECSSPFLITNKHDNKLQSEKKANSNDFDTIGKASFSISGDQSSSMADSSIELDRKTVDYLLDGREEELTKKAALNIVYGTNSRHRQDEELNQLNQTDNGLNDSPIGQLTYRLFAPCQLVNSSSCFSINPVNSSSPLARRGSVDLNGSGISSENAQPSSCLLGAQQGGGNGGSSTTTEPQQVVTSFGAFFPALSSDVVMSSGSGNNCGGNSLIGGPNIESNNNSSNKSSNQPSTGGSRFTTNEFESVDAIKRRMEIYVTTNSMKVIAGETLIVNLSDVLSCLSTAIEQTCAKASVGQRGSTSWVSVYILYAAVEEPQLPNQLLAQQKLRELTLIDESVEENCEIDEQRSKEEKQQQQQQGLDNKGETTKSLFDDDFTGSFDNKVSDSEEVKDKEVAAKTQQQQVAATTSGSQTIRVEQNPYDSSLTLYNSAYDRTVALPTQPDNHLDISEPFECQTDCLWLNENDVIETLVDQMAQPDSELESSRKRRKKKKKKKKSKKQNEDSQCSIM